MLQILFSLYLSQAQSTLEWVPLVFDPPSSTPVSHMRRITLQRGVAPRVDFVDPIGAPRGFFVVKDGTPILDPTFSGTSWCLWPDTSAALSQVVVELGITAGASGNIAYDFSVNTREVSVTSLLGCGTVVRIISPPNVVRVSSLMWIQETR